MHAFRIFVAFGEPKINDVYVIPCGFSSYQEIIWLDISMYDLHNVMAVVECRDQLTEVFPDLFLRQTLLVIWTLYANFLWLLGLR